MNRNQIMNFDNEYVTLNLNMSIPMVTHEASDRVINVGGDIEVHDYEMAETITVGTVEAWIIGEAVAERALDEVSMETATYLDLFTGSPLG